MQRLKPMRILQGGMGKIVCCKFNVQGAKGWRTKAKRWHPCLRKLVKKICRFFSLFQGLLQTFYQIFFSVCFYQYTNVATILLIADQGLLFYCKPGVGAQIYVRYFCRFKKKNLSKWNKVILQKDESIRHIEKTYSFLKSALGILLSDPRDRTTHGGEHTY